MNSSFAKGLSILDFFQEGRISAHLDDIVEALGTSKATTYRYLGTLCDAGLLAPMAGGVYVLGPRIIELDRLIRTSDPLLKFGSKVMQEVSSRRKLNMLLASYYRDSIMCVDIAWPDASIPAAFERGKPMSLFRGAMAKIILANLSTYQQRNMMLRYTSEMRSAGFGETWPEFRTLVANLAKQGYAITRAEMLAGAGGISAPIFDPDDKVMGSITFVLSESKWDEIDFPRLGKWIQDAASRITQQIALDSQQDMEGGSSIETAAPATQQPFSRVRPSSGTSKSDGSITRPPRRAATSAK